MSFNFCSKSFSSIPSNRLAVSPKLFLSFPEYANLWEKWPNANDKEFQELFEYCTKIYPERFFDVLYQNVDIFLEESETNTHFLPNVDFKLLFNCEGVSESNQKKQTFAAYK